MTAITIRHLCLFFQRHSHRNVSVSYGLYLGNLNCSGRCLFESHSHFFSVIWNSCVCCALVGVMFMTTGIVALKQLTRDDIPTFQVVFTRGLIALPILIPVGYRQTGYVFGPQDHNTKWILIRATCSACALLFSSFSLTLLSLLETAFLNDTYPGRTNAV